MNQAEWFVYILSCGDGSLYTGITNNLERRLDSHNKGKASRYTRARLPVTLIYSEKRGDRSTASIREAEIKRLSRAEKDALVQAT
ncbi:MAG: GIY-YIG nuclease family protein [Deltaproteobacteria bacterium]|nr:GIY-YIG nuclease family protein [Deltaproteobacteria bacterium]